MNVATTLDSEVVTVFLTNRLGYQCNTYGDILEIRNKGNGYMRPDGVIF